MARWFRTFMGLPLHPLIDHFAVVLFPIALVALLLLLVSRRLRARYGWLTIAVLTIGTLCVLVAKESGEQLATEVDLPAKHAHYGDLLTWVALPTWLLATIWFLLRRRNDRRIEASQDVGTPRLRESGEGAHAVRQPGRRSGVTTLLGALTGLGALASLVLVAVVGHTGAQATWAGTEGDTPSATSAPTASTSGASSATASGGATASTSGAYTIAQVATHKNKSSCWSAINGSVYDLTAWVSQHPGGADKILAICGKDGSTAFNTQHGSGTRAKQILAKYKIGTLTK